MSETAEVKREYWNNGKLKSETHYKNGEREGLETAWYESGQKEGEGDYKDGTLERMTLWY